MNWVELGKHFYWLQKTKYLVCYAVISSQGGQGTLRCFFHSVLNCRPISLISQESAEHHNRMLCERAQEIQELRKRLSEREQQLVTSERQSSTAAQEGHLETAELRALLAEKDSIINVNLYPHETQHAYWNPEFT